MLRIVTDRIDLFGLGLFAALTRAVESLDAFGLTSGLGGYFTFIPGMTELGLNCSCSNLISSVAVAKELTALSALEMAFVSVSIACRFLGSNRNNVVSRCMNNR